MFIIFSTTKSESGMHILEYEILEKASYEQKIKEGRNTEFSHSEEDGASKEKTDAQEKEFGAFKKDRMKQTNLKGQTKYKKIRQDYKNKSHEADGKGKVYHEGEKKEIEALDLKDRRKKKGTIADRARDAKGGEELDKQGLGRKKVRERGDGHIKFDEDEKDVKKCGDMKVAKSEKLSNFLKKNTSNEQ